MILIRNTDPQEHRNFRGRVIAVGRLGNEFVIFSYKNFAPLLGVGRSGVLGRVEAGNPSLKLKKKIRVITQIWLLPSWEFSAPGPSTAAALSRTSLLV